MHSTHHKYGGKQETKRPPQESFRPGRKGYIAPQLREKNGTRRMLALDAVEQRVEYKPVENLHTYIFGKPNKQQTVGNMKGMEECVRSKMK